VCIFLNSVGTIAAQHYDDAKRASKKEAAVCVASLKNYIQVCRTTFKILQR